MIEHKYSLLDFNNIHQDADETQLPEEVIDIIIQLTKEVTSPGYIKTPQFNKKHDEWVGVLKFNKTEIKKADDFDEIRKNINKLSTNNYDILSQKILEEIKNCDDKTRVSETIFAIASSNRFYSKLYAQLYNTILIHHDNVKTIFYEKCSDVLTQYNTIRKVSPEENYELFCTINKENEQRKAVTTFLLNLMVLNVVDEEFIMDILENLFLQLQDNIKDKEKVQIVNEIIELIYSIMTFSEKQYSSKKWKAMCVNIENLTKLTPNAGLSNKTIFKCMDIHDSILKFSE